MTADPVPFHLWHAETPEGALAALECAATGLSAAEVTTRRARFGLNVLPKAPPTPLWRIYLRQFENPLIYLLLAAAAVSVVIGEWVDALFIFLILQFNAVIGVVQERKAADTAGALDAMIRVWTTVRRDGRTERIDGVDLVPGDVVLLESGMQAPADARLLREQELRVDESLLTGESAPVEKDAGAVLAPETGVADRVNMLFAGTTVVNGRAEAVIAQTGVHTEVGRIAQALAGVAMPSAPIIVRLEKFTRAIGIVIVAAIALLAVFQFQQGLELRQIFFAAVALAVSAIPEGLPVAITIALSGASRRMAARNVIARSLPAVEGLGECTAIASDKTGTLTVNEMTVKRLVLPDGREIAVGGEGYVPEGGFSVEGGAPDEATDAAVRRLARAGALCNEAAFRREADGTHRFGDTVDVAFLVLAAKTGLWRESLIAAAPETRFIPFEPARRFAASFNRAADGTVALSVKGAAEA
ncbi:MAG: HAD-IC family P-type ATPase, partial [Pseudomonadota bacterium]